MQEKITRANAKLERLTIMQRGKRLTLRGTLPPKPGDGDRPKQYTISPGLPASPEGLKLAVIEAQKIEADLIYDRFSWAVDSDKLTVGNAVKEFEQHYWSTREKTVNRSKSNPRKKSSNNYTVLTGISTNHFSNPGKR